ncbi:MAG: DUF4334 domain-containing protein [Spirochaetes bacterium]|nr:DUF4334 domain-containing protein [Spirochaetota bacterium]
MYKYHELIKQGKATTEEALHMFDSLDTVNIEDMKGRWKGSGFLTNHPMDGLLEAFSWYGKEFIDADNVHPLLFTDRKKNLFKVDPKKMPMGLAVKITVPKNKFVILLFHFMKFYLSTEKPKARLRMLEHRGKSSATMIYDDLPIFDIFRKIDNDNLLGLMDLKGVEQPFFFLLKRD